MSEPQSNRLGLSGRLARSFQGNPLTPVLAIAGLLLGLLAVLITPREEEPQIDVTMANVFVGLPGSPAVDVENLVSVPLQQTLAEIEGVKHVYAMSRPGMAVVTVEFDVGVPRREALVRLYNQVYANADLLPQDLGASPPLVRPMGIDDVPVMSLTLWTDDPERGATELGAVARSLESELKRVAGTRDVYTLGAPQRAVIVELDASRLSAYNLSVSELAQALAAANVVRQAGERVSIESRQVPLTAGAFLASAEDVQDLVIGLHAGKPLLLTDVATVRAGADLPTSYVWHAEGAGSGRHGPANASPAVTLAIAKKPGANASDITRAIQRRVADLEGSLIPEGVHVAVTRDYGATANDKAMTLISKLVFATLAVVLLVLFALGWREAVVVGSAVVLTLAVTLFASWAMGFTINRVSLFALIFAIGILVDDAIVVVENIHRHMSRGGQTLRQALPLAVDEIGGPTILATFTVIAALLPMAFVSGLMGPYMRPIPINASVGMLLSLLIALTVTPWLAVQLLSRHYARIGEHAAHGSGRIGKLLDRGFNRILRPFLDAKSGLRRRRWLFAGMAGLVALSLALVVLQAVVLKMLPFDNKSEFQVVLDMPEGSTLEHTNAVLQELSLALLDEAEVASVQAYAGISAPVNFNGLVRQYYLREGANLGDLQVNLVDRSQRARKSHDIARAMRPRLQAIAAGHDAALKVVEVPPGPPVLAPLVVEVYGPDAERTRAIARGIAAAAGKVPGLVDIDTSVESDATRELVVVDRVRAAALGVSQQAITEVLQLAVSGHAATYLREGSARAPISVQLRLPAAEQARIEELLALKVRAQDGALVPLVELVEVRELPWESTLMQKDLLPVVYVMADEAGALDSPLYGMFGLAGLLDDAELVQPVDQRFFSAPEDAFRYSIKWDGEWQVTWQTFRDMGVAYAAGLLLIYLLIVAQFRSYLLPLIIMAPIPLTVIGVMPGHALLGAQFTATSMIGMIALAGIIVRNSILLVDFIHQAEAEGLALADAVVQSCVVRAQPILLTALAAMLGALFILDDPIFNGLAISLIFGIAISTLLTLVVIPLLYYATQNPGHAARA